MEGGAGSAGRGGGGRGVDPVLREILAEEPARVEHMARYAVRPPLAADRVHEREDGRVLLEIPPDPRTGATALSLDPIEWIRRRTNQTPDPKTHLLRYYGVYANRCRRLYREAMGEGRGSKPREAAPADPTTLSRRRSWARLLKKVFEVEMTCPRCGTPLVVVSFVRDPEVVDRILRHVREEEVELLFEARAPPAA